MWLGHGNGPSKRRPTKQWRKRGKATKEPSHEIQRCGTWHTMKRLIPLCWIFSTKVGEFLFRCFFVGRNFATFLLVAFLLYCVALYCLFLVYLLILLRVSFVSTLGLVLMRSSFLCLFCLLNTMTTTALNTNQLFDLGFTGGPQYKVQMSTETLLYVFDATCWLLHSCDHVRCRSRCE